MTTLQTEGLIAVRCILRDQSGRPLGLGHASSVVSRINKATERLFFGLLNGSLMSGINSACKSLDAIRLGEEDERYEADRNSRYSPSTPEPTAMATEKQIAYARQLIATRVSAESDQESMLGSISTMTREEISSLIQELAE
jgi:hypothetical protein